MPVKTEFGQASNMHFRPDNFVKSRKMNYKSIQELLDKKYEQFNRPDFIPDDPISVPHSFSLKQDIEIAAFFAAILAWGQRKTIINKCNELMKRMDNAPYQFVLHHSSNDLKKLLDFKHRTFNSTDTLYFIEFFKRHYQSYDSLEKAFTKRFDSKEASTEKAISGFYTYFFDDEDAPTRTRKHIASPERNSSCKRINMFLRWMVRKDNKGVDFGIWNEIKPSQLICPCDVHVDRVGRKLNLISRPKTDWKTAVELTENLKKFDQNDPVKYDFALFGLGIEHYF